MSNSQISISRQVRAGRESTWTGRSRNNSSPQDRTDRVWCEGCYWLNNRARRQGKVSEHINNFPPLPKSMQQICPVPEHLPIQFYDLWSWFWFRHFLIFSSIEYKILQRAPFQFFFMIIPPKWPTIPLFIHFLFDVLDISQPRTKCSGGESIRPPF